MGRCRGALVLLGCLAAAAAPLAQGFCETAEPFLSCVNQHFTNNWVMLNWTTAALFPRKSPLLTPIPLVAGLGKGNNPNFLGILPVNDMVTQLFNAVPAKLHKNCWMTVLRKKDVLAMAADSSSPYYGTFSACPNAPVPSFTRPATDARMSFVYGAFEDLSKVPNKDLSELPAFKKFKKSYSALGPNMAVCAVAQPCKQSLYVGLKNFKKYLSFNYTLGPNANVRAIVRPDSLFYSVFRQDRPPEWSADSTAWVWHLEDPKVPGAVGFFSWIEAVSGTTPDGTQYVKGPMANGGGKNVVTMRNVTIDFGRQTSAWLLVRDDIHRAVSFGLSQAPEIALWGKLALPFRTKTSQVKGLAFSNVQLTTRAADGHFWLTNPSGQNMNLSLFLDNFPAIAAPVKRILDGVSSPSQKLDALHLHHTGSAITVRLDLKGDFPLTPAASAITGVDSLIGEGSIIVTALFGKKDFLPAATLDYFKMDGKPLKPRERSIYYCKKHNDCPQQSYFPDSDFPRGFFYDCNAALKVCVPIPVPLPAGGGVAAATPQLPLVPPPDDSLKEPDTPLGYGAMEAALGRPGVQRRLGTLCDVAAGAAACPWPLVCQLDEATQKTTCQP